ncbi:HD domain-containing protein [Marinobacterium weihaiense]|uniref:HD domain-containing protein n=1 Tax=Marinobacterium weihaiense TaxID=2851016 RepID=A0ABS6M6B2_9GAMM|nr:HD domain-containing protein [Marinobacterium weihaiense]MBV0931765.1 HD domain-containing protein [Marinobacterium weihaiense]
MSAKDDTHTLHSLSDLLGSDRLPDTPRSDLFERVAHADDGIDCTPGVGFDEEAFHGSRSLVMPTSQAREICLARVRDYALAAHKGQVRRYTREPYWKHLADVAGLVTTSRCSTPRALALAWLHDIVEDTAVTLREIERDFGASIADGVRCLTGSANTMISREARKRRDRERLAAGDADVHTVKLADMASNLSSIGLFDPDFALGGYLEEKRLEMGVLTQGDEGLRKLVRALWLEARQVAERAVPTMGDPF